MTLRSFSARDANDILKIPLSSRHPTDQLIWNQTNSGAFTVRSAYYLAVNKFSKLGRNLSSSSTVTPIWKKMWSKKLPPKICHFLWRASLDAIPTATDLRRRGIPIDPICQICGLEGESADHALLRCTTAIHTWGISSLKLDSHLLRTSSFRNLLGELIDNFPDHGVSIFEDKDQARSRFGLIRIVWLTKSEKARICPHLPGGNAPLLDALN